jgi:hypothetical protein
MRREKSTKRIRGKCVFATSHHRGLILDKSKKDGGSCDEKCCLFTPSFCDHITEGDVAARVEQRPLVVVTAVSLPPSSLSPSACPTTRDNVRTLSPSPPPLGTSSGRHTAQSTYRSHLSDADTMSSRCGRG